jgi:predicted metal-dependent hydrolase
VHVASEETGQLLDSQGWAGTSDWVFSRREPERNPLPALGDRAPAAFQERFKQAANELLVPRVAYRAMKLGVKVARVKVADDRFRWGSCTPSGTVTVNWRLVKAPVGVADYVIVHELAHLLEANHGGNFWSIVRSHVTKVEAARAWLKEQGQLLEQDF